VTSSSVDQQIDPGLFRRVLGQYPTGVCVVTAPDPAGPVGMAVGSFTSVSLDPPLVAFLPDKRSKSWPKIRSSGRFCVNVLAEDQEDVCRVFATSGVDRFASVEWEVSPRGLPVLSGATAWIECELDAVYEAGDHYIAIGRVLELDVARPSLPLLFFQGGYGRFRPSSMVAADAQVIHHLRKADAARHAMEQLADSVGVQCDASVLIGEEVVIIASAGQPRTVIPNRVGIRVAFVAPIGVPFAAWAPELTAAWLRRAGPQLTAREAETYRGALERVRAAGCAIMLGSAGMRRLVEIVSRTSPAATFREVARSRAHASVLTPAELAPGERYDMAALTAPVFDADGRVSMMIALVGFDREHTGAEIRQYADILLKTCRDITDIRPA